VKAASSEAVNRSLNVVSGVSTTWGETVRALLDAAGWPGTPIWRPRSLTWATRRTFSNREAAGAIDFRAGTSIGDGMKALVGWWQAGGAEDVVGVGGRRVEGD
jgi:nucleoside-diphosphate-sugar epimerase